MRDVWLITTHVQQGRDPFPLVGATYQTGERPIQARAGADPRGQGRAQPTAHKDSLAEPITKTLYLLTPG
jgi:hypothetical protein